jgi:hypothetical protein
MKCVENPKTKKPFTKHKLVSEPRVIGYYLGGYGDQKPMFNNEVRCKREGCLYLWVGR